MCRSPSLSELLQSIYTGNKANSLADSLINLGCTLLGPVDIDELTVLNNCVTLKTVAPISHKLLSEQFSRRGRPMFTAVSTDEKKELKSLLFLHRWSQCYHFHFSSYLFVYSFLIWKWLRNNFHFHSNTPLKFALSISHTSCCGYINKSVFLIW